MPLSLFGIPKGQVLKFCEERNVWASDGVNILRDEGETQNGWNSKEEEAETVKGIVSGGKREEWEA